MFKIDFFELMFLAQACIPPAPIARSMFFEKLIDVYYKQMSKDERKRLYDCIVPKLDMREETSRIFEARYNKDNQFVATINYKGEKQTIQCFKYNDKYRTCISSYIEDKYIIKIEKETL